jgi:hypothetical protein
LRSSAQATPRKGGDSLGEDTGFIGSGLRPTPPSLADEPHNGSPFRHPNNASGQLTSMIVVEIIGEQWFDE